MDSYDNEMILLLDDDLFFFEEETDVQAIQQQSNGPEGR